MSGKTAATKLQDRVIKNAGASFDKGRNVLVEAPTGAGKTRIYSKIACQRAQKGERTLVLTERQKLVEQGICGNARWNGNEIATSQGMNGEMDQSGQIVFSTVQTALALKSQLQRYDNVIIDEGHHATKQNKYYEPVIEQLQASNPDLRVLAVTATPPDDLTTLIAPLTDVDRHIITFDEAIAAKLIKLPETLAPPIRLLNGKTVEEVVRQHIDHDGDAITGISTELRKGEPDDWNDLLVNRYQRHLQDRSTIAFFDRIADAKAFADTAAEYGIHVDVLHSGNKPSHNKQIFDDFEARPNRLIASVDMISEGADIGASGILLAKKTTSPREYRQIIGRAARSYADADTPQGLVVDMGASTYLHGDIAAQAAMSQVRKLGENAERDVLPNGRKSSKIWVDVANKPKCYATQIDGDMIFLMRKEDGYAAFRQCSSRKGKHLETLKIEAQKPGAPQIGALSKWLAPHIERNERKLARLTRGPESELRMMANEIWERHGPSMMSAYNMLQVQPRNIIAKQSETSRNAAQMNAIQQAQAGRGY